MSIRLAHTRRPGSPPALAVETGAGAMGVSGAEPSAVDAQCANAGLEKLKTLL
jgi:uncharacterized protein GlcG (DUF336 family)